MSVKIKEFFITVFLGTLICVCFGLIIYGTAIFSLKDMRIVILLYGFYGAIFYAGLKYLKLREQISSILFVILFTILLKGKSSPYSFYLRDIYLLLPLFLSIYLYFIFLLKYPSITLFIRGLSLVLLFPVFYMISFVPLLLIYDVNLKSTLPSLLISFRLSIIVGLGLAISFDLYEKYKTYILRLLNVV